MNGGFETGSGWTMSSVFIWQRFSGVDPKSGRRLLASSGAPASIYQMATIPASAPYLRFSYYVVNSSFCSNSPYLIVHTNDGIISLQIDACNTTGWVTGTVNMTSIIGSTKNIVFEFVEENAGGAILIDDIGFVSEPTRVVDYYPSADF